jgi:hypothetical protein
MCNEAIYTTFDIPGEIEENNEKPQLKLQAEIRSRARHSSIQKKSV